MHLLREYSVRYNLISTTHVFDVILSTGLPDHDSSLIGLFRFYVISINFKNTEMVLKTDGLQPSVVMSS